MPNDRKCIAQRVAVSTGLPGQLLHCVPMGAHTWSRLQRSLDFVSTHEFSSTEAHVQDAELVPQIRDRAKIALKNAEIRKRKASLITRITDLETIIKKGKVNKEAIALRRERMAELMEKVQSVPDGGVSNTRRKVQIVFVLNAQQSQSAPDLSMSACCCRERSQPMSLVCLTG
jgi:hypothetical protein